MFVSDELSTSFGLNGLCSQLFQDGVLEQHHLESLEGRDPPREKAHYLLYVLQRKPPNEGISSYQTLLKALQSTGFEHVVAKLEATNITCSDRRRLSSSSAENRETVDDNHMKLQKRKKWIMDRLDTEVLNEYLVEMSVLDMDEIERIEREVTLKNKAKRLIEIILEKRSTDQGNDPVLCFIEALRKSKQDFVANELENTKLAVPAGK